MKHFALMTPLQRYNLVLLTKPTKTQDKKKYAEILTPINICQEMISKGAEYIECLQKKLKRRIRIIEPCCGKGAFVVCLYQHLLSLGYTEQQILEKILYINDINQYNTFIVKLILNPLNQYKLHIYNCNALEDIDYAPFDLVVTNPPYNKTNNTGDNFYKEFIKKFSVTNQLLIVPNNWRDQELYPKLQFCKMFSKKINIFKINSGMYIDIILLMKDQVDTHQIIYQDGTEQIFTDTKFVLTNYYKTQTQQLYNVVSKRNHQFVVNKNNTLLQNTKSDEYKYIVINSTAKTKLNIKYTNKRLQNFGPKLIFGIGANQQLNSIIDLKDKYQITDNCVYIKINSKEQAQKIQQILCSEEYSQIEQSFNQSNSFRSFYKALNYIELSKYLTQDEINFMSF